MSRSVAHQLSSIIPFSVISQIAKEIRIVPLIVLLGTPIPLWLVCEAIAAQSVQAYTARVDLAIDTLPEENYETILRRAEAVARAAAQRSFDQDILVTDVSVVVTAQNYGAIAPVFYASTSLPSIDDHVNEPATCPSLCCCLVCDVCSVRRKKVTGYGKANPRNLKLSNNTFGNRS